VVEFDPLQRSRASEDFSASDNLPTPPTAGQHQLIQLTLAYDFAAIDQLSCPLPQSDATQAHPISDNFALTELQQQGLLLELVQLRSQTQTQLTRIQQLEQALDQSQLCIREVQQQLIEQQFLENQLATTEEIANIQQQAIHQLKLQLSQKQQALDLAQANLEQEQRVLHEILRVVEELSQSQNTDVNDFCANLLRERSANQSLRHSLHSDVDQLKAVLEHQQQRVSELEAEAALRAGWETTLIEMLVSTQTTLLALAETASDESIVSVAEKTNLLNQLNDCLSGLQQSLQQMQTVRDRPHFSVAPISPQEFIEAQNRIGELETQLARTETAKLLIQHAHQEAEVDRERQRSRLADLESQVAEMQEQILHQAQQASEYETAVQHWKDRYVHSYQQIQQLKHLLDGNLENLPSEVQEILADLEANRLSAIDQNQSSAITPARFNRDTQLDLPDFLLRRRSYKTRRLS